MANESDVRLVDILGYLEWSQHKIDSGGSPDIIANLDSNCMWLSPEELASVKTDDFEEMYKEVEDELDN